jgi:PHP family Zn ribbon phosphoesterase
MDVPLKDIGDAGSSILQEAVSRMRAGKVNIKPGFDGEYGKIEIFISFPKELLASVRY